MNDLKGKRQSSSNLGNLVKRICHVVDKYCVVMSSYCVFATWMDNWCISQNHVISMKIVMHMEIPGSLLFDDYNSVGPHYLQSNFFLVFSLLPQTNYSLDSIFLSHLIVA